MLVRGYLIPVYLYVESKGLMNSDTQAGERGAWWACSCVTLLTTDKCLDPKILPWVTTIQAQREAHHNTRAHRPPAGLKKHTNRELFLNSYLRSTSSIILVSKYQDKTGLGLIKKQNTRLIFIFLFSDNLC